MIKLFKYDKVNKMYWTSTTIDNKSCVIAFGKYKGDNVNETNVYSVAFGIGANRKQVLNWLFGKSNFIDMKITGDGCLKPLIWAKNMLFEFEKFIINNSKNEVIKIAISGEDERRYKAYKSYLIKHGYKSNIGDNELTKILK